MSWVYLPGPEADCLPLGSSGGERSARSRSSRTVNESSRSASATACSTRSRSGTTCARSTGDRGADALTSSPAGFLAKTYLPPAVVPAYQALARVFGLRCYASLARFGLRMSLPRTPRTYALEDWTSSSAGLPSWGTLARGVCSELGTSVRLTDETGCGSLLPTPTGAGNENSPSMQKWAGHRNLARLMLPTPCATHYGSNGDPKDHAAGRQGKRRPNLQKAAARLGLLPTPVAQAQGVTGGPYIALREWMMGWPLGWSACEPLATGRYQRWLRSHGASSPR